MPQCAQFRIVTNSDLSSTTEQPVLTAEPIPVSQCQGYLLLTPAEYSAMNTPFFVPLSITDGASIALGIAALWGLAFAYRNIGRFISPSTNED